MDVLVTGGAGFIGSFLCGRLISPGCFVTILDNLDPQVHPNGVPFYIPSNAKLVVANVCDTDALGSEIEGAGISASFRKGDIRHCLADITRAEELLGFKPWVSWEEGLGEFFEWARSDLYVDRSGQAEAEPRRFGLVRQGRGRLF